MTKEKQFCNQDTPSIIDTEYQRCNFGHDEAIEVGGEWKGHRLFPGDDTPRTFVNCNLINCETPPDSILIGCNRALIRPAVLISQSDDIIIDGEAISIDHCNKIVLGKWNGVDYDYFPSPKVYLFDRETE